MADFVKKLLLNLYYWPMFAVVTALSPAALLFLLLFLTVFTRRTVPQAIRYSITIYGWVLVKMVPFFAPVQVEYRAGKVPDPCIYVANHNSAVDPYLFGALFLPDASFITSWPFKIPFYGPLMRIARYINTEDGWDRVCENGMELLKKGTSIIVWPEGHRSRDGRLGRFKNGAFMLAARSGYPVVPVCITGSWKLMPPGRKLLTPSRVRMALLEPVYPVKHPKDEEHEVRSVRNAVHGAIAKHLKDAGSRPEMPQ